MRFIIGKVLLAIIGLVSHGSALAAGIEATASTKISTIQAYTEFGGGDFIFTTTATVGVCNGYWLPQTSPGTSNLIAMVIAAQKANTLVRVWGHTDDNNRWPGSTQRHFCKVYSVLDEG